MKTEPNHAGRTTLGAVIILCALGVIAGSCARCDLDSAGKTEEGKNTMLRIVLGEGGGFAGTWDGYTITGTGAVYKWSGKGARENEVEIGTLDADTMCTLWDEAKALRTVPPTDSAGSLVRFLSLTVQDTTREYTWRPQLGQSPFRPLYQHFYDHCLIVVQKSLLPTTKNTVPSGK
ncbi:MAG: hypothetical protein H6Q31_49 [Bacteroidetes bacterium]|nr:hypothetical protein [Bacteroidota bacterium]